jgi:hypothetical protein
LYSILFHTPALHGSLRDASITFPLLPLVDVPFWRAVLKYGPISIPSSRHQFEVVTIYSRWPNWVRETLSRFVTHPTSFRGVERIDVVRLLIPF